MKMLKLPVYLDYNATTPCDPRVVEAMLPYFSTNFGNAASHNHSFGWQAEEAVENAREKIALLVGAESKEIIFTSGATEAVNLAIKGVFEMYRKKGNHIITTRIEHKAVLDTCRHLEKEGAEITYLNVNSEGLIDVNELKTAFKPNTILVVVMYANNEVGTLMPLKEISSIVKEKEVIFFCDATQAVGKVPVDVIKDGIDIMAFSAHKMYGPKGTGALYVRRKNPRVKLVPQIVGGGHERGMRSGTLNVPAIVGFGKAAALCINEMEEEAKRIYRLRIKLENALMNIGGTSLNGSRNYRLPNVTNLSFRDAESDNLLMEINKNIAVSTGSACMSETMEPSYVLKALGLTDKEARSSLRFSLGRFTTEEEIDYVVEQVTGAIKKINVMNTLVN